MKESCEFMKMCGTAREDNSPYTKTATFKKGYFAVSPNFYAPR